MDRALPLFRRAVEAGLPDDLLFRTLWDIAELERRLAAPEIWTDLAASRNPYRVKALDELAKHAEHADKNYAAALEFTREALALEDSVDLEKREQRLNKKNHAKSQSRKARISKDLSAMRLLRIFDLIEVPERLPFFSELLQQRRGSPQIVRGASRTPRSWPAHFSSPTVSA